MTTEQNMKTLFAAIGYCAAAFCVMRFASARGHNYGPMVVSTVLPFVYSFGLTYKARFSPARCALSAAFVFLFMLYSVWFSGLEAVGILPIILMPLSVFVGSAVGERFHQTKNRG